MIEIAVSDAAALAARRGHLQHLGDAGIEMHLALGVPLGDAGRFTSRYTASPEAWDTFVAWAATAGAVRPGATDAAQREARAISRARETVNTTLDRLARHPGYRGVAMAGRHVVVLPARRCGEGRWWPTRRMALANSDGTSLTVEMTDLVPDLIRRRGRVFTMWVTASQQ